jgi:hypothetical protein
VDRNAIISVLCDIDGLAGVPRDVITIIEQYASRLRLMIIAGGDRNDRPQSSVFTTSFPPRPLLSSWAAAAAAPSSATTPSATTMMSLAALPVALMYPLSCRISHDCVLVAGGQPGRNDGGITAVSSMYVYSISSNKWTKLVDTLPDTLPLKYSSMVMFGGYATILGGSAGAGSGSHNHVYQWIPTSVSSTPNSVTASTPPYGIIEAAAIDAAAAASSLDTNMPSIAIAATTSSGTWRQLPSMIHPRSGHTSVVVGDHLYVIGGVNDEHKVVGTVESYQLGSVSWISLNSIPTSLHDHASIVVDDGKQILTTGGEDGGRYMLSWLYDIKENSWRPLPPSCNLPIRNATFSLVMDDDEGSRGRRIHLIGGDTDNGPTADCWSIDERFLLSQRIDPTRDNTVISTSSTSTPSITATNGSKTPVAAVGWQKRSISLPFPRYAYSLASI